MKVADLEGALLDYWVAKAEGHKPFMEGGNVGIPLGMFAGEYGVCTYSTNWEQGGPIIEREGMFLQSRIGVHVRCIAKKVSHLTGDELCVQTGRTLLEAAMRCYVASKFGDEVEG